GDDLAAELEHGGRHGHSPGASMPSVSASPSIRFIDCTAWPAPPLTRLSSAVHTASWRRPVRGSSCPKVQDRSTYMLPLTATTSAPTFGPSTRTNGASP